MPFTAGGLKDNLSSWTEITSDPFILDAVAHCHLEFDSLPTPDINNTRSHFSFNVAEQQIIDSEIEKFLGLGIIAYSVSEPGEILSPIFVTPKKDGTSRVIFNLKNLNNFIVYHHFKMDTLHAAINLMTPGCFMTSIDLKNAYYSIPMATEHQKYLKFIWRDTLYCFTCLPMGLSSSPRIFTKVMKPVFATLRAKYGHMCLGYIDDSFYTAQTFVDCLQATLHAVKLISKLGFYVHPDKSVLIPTQSLEFLGFVLCSINMTVTLTAKKKQKIHSMCLRFLKPNASFTIRQVAALIGSLVFSFPGVEFGPLYYRSIEHDKDTHLRRHQGQFDAEMSLSQDSRQDIQWWFDNITLASKRILHSHPNIIIYTDASQSGWGGKLESGISTCGIWSRDEVTKHINYLELAAIQLSLLSLLNDKSNIHIRIMCDNTTAVSYINSMGGCKSPSCNEITKAIWEWAIPKNVWLSAAHIACTSNVEADILSREFNSKLEWMLSPATFQKIVRVFSQPDIDLFASRLNAQLQIYVSWKPDPKASFIDAFSIDWSNFLFYAFPPYCLISRCLQKVIQDQATGIIVVPFWPTQPFFSVLLSLLVAVPQILGVTRHNLIHPMLSSPHPLVGHLNLLVCKVSGDRYASLTFRQKLSTQLCIPGEIAPRNSTAMLSTNGGTFVFQGHMIPYNQL